MKIYLVDGTYELFRSHFGAPPKELTGDLYRDALVIAFPTPRAESAVGRPTWTGNVGSLDLTPLLA